MSKVRIKLDKRFFSILFSLILIISLIFLYNFYFPKPIKSWKIDNFVFVFREDLRKASKINVFPSEKEIYSLLVNPKVEKITIAFKNASEENYYYTLQTYEIVYKLTLFFKIKGLNISFSSMEINSYDEISGKPENPIIALVHPKFANETLVKVKNYVIYIEGKNPEEFDLATIKFLMSAMGIQL